MRQIHLHDSARLGTLRHAQLLVVLVAFHLAAPAVEMWSRAAAGIVLLPAYAVLLGSVTFAISGSRGRLATVLLGVVAVLATGAVGVLGIGEGLLLAVAVLPFLVHASRVVMRDVLSAGAVDEARLLGSASMFLLMSQVWAGVYAGMEWLSPGSFTAAAGGPADVGDLSYFSLVTQTTLGYGDVTPTSPVARASATLQAACGLFYMGVVVARFAGRLELGGRTSGGEGRGAE